MATRHQNVAAAPQPANRGAAVPAAKQKAAAGVARPRRALGDIGNFVGAQVVGGKIQLPEGINRPITRSFGAQLLKNAQANGAAANKIAIAPPAYPAAARAAPKPARKAPAKPAPRPEQATKKISTGPSDESKKPSQGAVTSSSGSALKHSRKKVVNTLTSVLTTRSKVACGLTGKPKDLIEDIDKLDGDNELAVVDYIEDIYKYYKIAQHESRPFDYMSSQLEITPKMRAILADWIVEVHDKFELMPETLYLTIYVIDRYLSMQVVPRRELQLVGMAAMLIACKYEEIWAPEVNDFISIADNSYSRQQILAMEKNILNKMEWNLTLPTPYMFLVRFVKAAGSDKELEHMVFYYAETALKEYGMVSLCPSMLAASAVYAARCTLKKTPVWTDTLKHHTSFDESQPGLWSQLIECAKVLVSAHAPEGKLKAVYRKYATEKFGRVSLRAPTITQAHV